MTTTRNPVTGALLNIDDIMVSWSGAGARTFNQIASWCRDANVGGEFLPTHPNAKKHAGRITRSLQSAGSGYIVRSITQKKYKAETSVCTECEHEVERVEIDGRELWLCSEDEGGCGGMFDNANKPRTAPFRGRWIVSMSRVAAEVGDAASDTVLVVELPPESDNLMIRGDAELARYVDRRYRTALETELFDAASISAWLKDLANKVCEGAAAGNLLHIPARHADKMKRLLTIVAAEWGASWTPARARPWLEVKVDDEGIKIGLAEGFAAEVDTHVAALAKAREVAERDRNATEISARRAAGLLGKADELGAKIEAYSLVCGEHIRPAVERLNALRLELTQLADDTVARFQAIELDGPTDADRAAAPRQPASPAERAAERAHAERLAQRAAEQNAPQTAAERAPTRRSQRRRPERSAQPAEHRASPRQLRSGDWGAIIRSPRSDVAVGDAVVIETRGGRNWRGTVVEVVRHYSPRIDRPAATVVRYARRAAEQAPTPPVEPQPPTPPVDPDSDSAVRFGLIELD